jgi:hypothetical protein
MAATEISRIIIAVTKNNTISSAAIAATVLIVMTFSVAGCLESDTQYQRPRSMDTPSIYASSPAPIGRLKDN